MFEKNFSAEISPEMNQKWPEMTILDPESIFCH